MGETRIWALVSNGVRARILRGLEQRPSEAPDELVSRARSSHLRLAVSDRSGRCFAPDRSGRRAAMEPGTDPIRRDMQDFARELLAMLEMHRRAGDFDRLVILAGPEMLGILRQERSKALERAIVLERAINLVQLPAGELADAIRDMLDAKPKG